LKSGGGDGNGLEETVVFLVSEMFFAASKQPSLLPGQRKQLENQTIHRNQLKPSHYTLHKNSPDESQDTIPTFPPGSLHTYMRNLHQ
jgi:hypothetical protein